MAFTPIGDSRLGNFLQIAYINTIRDQLSGDVRDFEMVKQIKEQDPMGKQVNFLLKTGRGPSAVQYVNASGVSAFPRGQRNRSEEKTAQYKRIYSTVEFDYKLWEQLKRSPSKRYADAFAEEIISKAIESKRRIGADFHGDGTGVMLTVASVSQATIAATGQITITADATDRGFIGLLIEDDVFKIADPDSTLRSPTGASGTAYGWLLLSKDRVAGTATFQLVDSDYSALTATASNVVAGDYLYRVAQPTVPDLTGAISDYGTVSEVIPGLESLAAADGRVVHGITMSGVLAGTVESSGGALSFTKIETVLNNAKIRVGETAYAYKTMLTSPEGHSYLINANEADRRLNSVEDQTRGGRKFIYQHRTDAVETMSSEFCRKDRVWFTPEAKANQGRVLEAHMTDFQAVKPNDMSEFRMSVVNGSYVDQMEANMTASGTLLTRHPAALASIRGFSLT